MGYFYVLLPMQWYCKNSANDSARTFSVLFLVRISNNRNKNWVVSNSAEKIEQEGITVDNYNVRKRTWILWIIKQPKQRRTKVISGCDVRIISNTKRIPTYQCFSYTECRIGKESYTETGRIIVYWGESSARIFVHISSAAFPQDHHCHSVQGTEP